MNIVFFRNISLESKESTDVAFYGFKTANKEYSAKHYAKLCVFLILEF